MAGLEAPDAFNPVEDIDMEPFRGTPAARFAVVTGDLLDSTLLAELLTTGCLPIPE